ncbi:protein THEM6-like [Mytilus edulis]|uniref:protein THEM6-like n=1 Tax=Mytilus edulis TaxID=6550 RepID=UPI0039F02A58
MWLLLLIICICFVFFDVWYFIRFGITCSFYTFTKSTSLFEESIFYGICLTTDLDFMIHMNNARYLRDCDFARFKFWIQSKAWKVVQKLGATMSNAGNNIRYRRSLQLFDIYKIKTKLVYWDDRSFYLEQQFIRTRDDFVCAVNIVKQTMIGCSPALIIEKLTGEQREPVLTEELKCLLESWQLSSERLRQSS